MHLVYCTGILSIVMDSQFIYISCIMIGYLVRLFTAMRPKLFLLFSPTSVHPNLNHFLFPYSLSTSFETLVTTLHLSWLVQDSLVLLPQGLEVTCDYPTVVYRHQQLDMMVRTWVSILTK